MTEQLKAANPQYRRLPDRVHRFDGANLLREVHLHLNRACDRRRDARVFKSLYLARVVRRALHGNKRACPAVARLSALGRIWDREPDMVPSPAQTNGRRFAHEIFLVGKWLFVCLVERPCRRPVRDGLPFLQPRTLPSRWLYGLAVQLGFRAKSVPFAHVRQRSGIYESMIARNAGETDPRANGLVPRRLYPRLCHDGTVRRGK